eukprot:CAMPEP_0176009486 /NCGR_PEP_ID=MMETSP0120_2-20121206/4276_1 /TAXON_ID=160619 /ORGANISM="Kryptoperidinium foliaceum, Strain CCMP 1326" /LENGTH=146 /DNA_ID=CAMNT_0017342285 /DNA_START=125 /DNA_END=565 /DNA_ORIENTATION=-
MPVEPTTSAEEAQSAYAGPSQQHGNSPPRRQRDELVEAPGTEQDADAADEHGVAGEDEVAASSDKLTSTPAQHMAVDAIQHAQRGVGPLGRLARGEPRRKRDEHGLGPEASAGHRREGDDALADARGRESALQVCPHRVVAPADAP